MSGSLIVLIVFAILILIVIAKQRSWFRSRARSLLSASVGPRALWAPAFTSWFHSSTPFGTGTREGDGDRYSRAGLHHP